MALKSNSEMAELCQQAIVQLVSGGVANYTIAGRTFTKLNLSELQRLFEHYKAAAEAEQTGGLCTTFADLRWNP